MRYDDVLGDITILVVMVLTLVFFLWMIHDRLDEGDISTNVVSNDISAMYVSPRLPGVSFQDFEDLGGK